MQVVHADLLRRLGAEDARGQLREARRGVPEVDRRQQVRELRFHGHRAWVAPLRVLLPLGELIRYLLVGAVLQKAGEEQVP